MSQKNKKKFSDGLEQMFQTSLFEGLYDQPEQRAAPGMPPPSAQDRQIPGASKSFADSLEQFLQETIDEIVEEKVGEIQEKGLETVRANKGRSNKPAIGIDALIRSTVESAEAYDNGKKRITFTFEKDKVEKLREIADQERSRIRDIVEDLINNFIQGYRWNQG
jgi:hypothetical protein